MYCSVRCWVAGHGNVGFENRCGRGGNSIGYFYRNRVPQDGIDVEGTKKRKRKRKPEKRCFRLWKGWTRVLRTTQKKFQLPSLQSRRIQRERPVRTFSHTKALSRKPANDQALTYRYLYL